MHSVVVSTVLEVAGVAVLAGVLATGCGRQGSGPRAARRANEPVGAPLPAGAVVFELQYRGLDGSGADGRYNSFWTFGTSGPPKSRFLRAVRKVAKTIEPTYNRELAGREWAAVEYGGREATALYFDLNADGALAPNERIAARQKAPGEDEPATEFVTPDFIAKAPDGRRIRFRVLVRVSFYGERTTPDVMWSPSCVLEATATVDGKPLRLTVLGSGFTGCFDVFRSASYELGSAAQAEAGPGAGAPRRPLSSLVLCDGRFFRLSFRGRYAEGESLQAVLVPDLSPTGQVSLRLAADQDLKATFDSVDVTGETDSNVSVSLDAGQDRLPVGRYRLASAVVDYGGDGGSQWRVQLRDGPGFQVAEATATVVEIGKPVVKVKAVEGSKRYDAKAPALSRVAKGTSVYLSPTIGTASGETVGYVYQATGDNRQMEMRPPSVRILNAAGETVVAKTMEYG